MRITEIAPPGREKQVKALKKKFDDKGAPYAIAWAQHNKHGKPKKNEGKMSDIDIDIKTMSDAEFEKKYGKSKEQLQKDLNEAFNSERDEVKAILDKHGIKNADDIEYGSDVYDELFNYFANSGEMPYGVMKARTGMPDEWIADRLDDLDLVEIADVPTQKGRDAKSNVLTPRAMNVVKKQIKKDANKQRRADSKKAVDVEEGPSDMGMNKYGLSATKFGDKFKSYQHGKLTGEFDSMEELQKHQLELIKDDESVDPMRTDMDAKKELAQEIYNNNKEYQAIYPSWEAFMNSDDFDEENDRLRSKFEAPFGAVKRAINKAKQVVGKVPGLGDIKTKADAEANIGKVANDVWKSYLQFKQTDPDAAQVKGWFKTNHGMDVEPDANANVDQDAIAPGIKQAMAQKQSRTQSTPDASPDDAKDVKVKMDLLKKSDPDASAATMVAIKKMAAGDIPIDPARQQALKPLMSKIAKALNNPGKANLLSRALAESLSQQDLSKLDMLARQGMVPKNKISRFKTAMRTLAKGKDLPISYKDDVIDVVMKLSKIITKPSVMGMVRKGLREQQDPKKMFDSWVNQGKEEHNI